VQPLGYSQADEAGPWEALLRVFSLAAMALGVTQLLLSAGQMGPALQMMWSNAGSRGSILGQGGSIYLIVELLEDAAAVGLILLGGNVFGRRPWVPSAFITAAAAIGLLAIATSVVRLFQMFTNPSISRAFAGAQMWYYLLSVLANAARGLILPALFVWLMTRPQIRRRFNEVRFV